ncbi:LysR family transcriptional regulator [Nocardia sp. NPDC003979]
MLTLREMEVILAVAEHGSLTAAARSLHLSQPSVSQAVSAVERRLGGPVFVRHPRGMKPTVQGAAALPVMRSCLQAARTVDRLTTHGHNTGLLRVGAASMASDAVFLDAIASWRETNPDIDIHVEEFTDHPYRRAEDGFLAGDLDVVIGIGREPIGSIGHTEILAVEELVVAGADPETLREQASAWWIAHPRGHPLDEAMNNHHAATGIVARYAARAGHQSTVIAMAAAGIGLTVLPRTLAYQSKLAFTALRPAARVTLVAWTPTAHDPTALMFTSFLHEAYSVEHRG